MRLIGQRLTDSWSQQIVLDNRGGAGAVIGTQLVASATPDGYTLLVTNTAHAINPALNRKLPYDSINDFIPISLLATQSNAVVVSPQLGVSGTEALIALAKAKPRSINFASVGIGSSAHLAGELFASMAHVEILHVPYKGTGAAVTDLIGGQVQLMFPPLLAIWPYVQAGRVKLLAVTAKQRSALAPGLPTVAEAGLPGYEATAWYMLFAPARTPSAVTAKLNAEIDRILRESGTRERLLRGGAEPGGGTQQDAQRFLTSEGERWTKVIRQSNAWVEQK